MPIALQKMLWRLFLLCDGVYLADNSR